MKQKCGKGNRGGKPGRGKSEWNCQEKENSEHFRGYVPEGVDLKSFSAELNK